MNAYAVQFENVSHPSAIPVPIVGAFYQLLAIRPCRPRFSLTEHNPIRFEQYGANISRCDGV
jgi:hypothetical protein